MKHRKRSGKVKGKVCHACDRSADVKSKSPLGMTARARAVWWCDSCLKAAWEGV